MTEKRLSLQLLSAKDEPGEETIAVRQAIIAGWTGRDAAAVEKESENIKKRYTQLFKV